MANNKNPNRPPSISELLHDSDVQASLIVFAAGVLIAFLGGTFLKNIQFLQMLAIFGGAVLSFTATEKIIKKMDEKR